MDKQSIVLEALKRNRSNLLKAINSAKETRDSAPSATESHSDTTRAQTEKLIFALDEQMQKLDKLINDFSFFDSLIYVELNKNSEQGKFILVPPGMGGIVVGDIRLLSSDTPLGSLLAGKKIGDKFDFNNESIEILRME